MSAPLPQDTELIEKHEGILGRRAELLEQMESLREQLKIQRRQQVEESEVARHRNSTLLQDLQKIEVRLKGRQLPRPNLLALEGPRQQHILRLTWLMLLKVDVQNRNGGVMRGTSQQMQRSGRSLSTMPGGAV
ncbi:uncharacterized protein C3orf14 homolog isoform X2 [Pseudoliparis swirei]|uniref:uncharacterized protein C3orf14 homolog isoform X2 n=1 Tax=Pseudoliparis swirei TaxID=2059687 RepID=UPI0024BEA4E3|nr:uncharacterized protein C3orf14 homolog isoform X2 [Pseudoliparis swirei]